MRRHRTAYELARSQVATPPEIVSLFWNITHRYRSHFSRVLDLGAGDGRFAIGGKYQAYEGIEIDKTRQAAVKEMPRASIRYGCAFRDQETGYAACIGNPPYVRHHDLDETWRDNVAADLSSSSGTTINRKCNLYVYFLYLALLKSKPKGLVSCIVPYEWVSRPSAKALRQYIRKNGWHVDTYRFDEPIFEGVLTTASISVIDKKNKDGEWCHFQLSRNGAITKLGQRTGTNREVLHYDRRGKLWAMRGMSPGTQKVFTLSEGERIHAGLAMDDVLPCVTSLREVPIELTKLTNASFKKRFVDAGLKCWLIRAHEDPISKRLRAYLDSIPQEQRDTWTCTTRDPWYRFPLSDKPKLLVSTGFRTYGPKILINSVGAHAVGSVCGIYADRPRTWSSVRQFLMNIDFERRVVPHAKELRKLEIGQLNAVLNSLHQWEHRHG